MELNYPNLITSIISFVLFLILVLFFVFSLSIRYRKRKRENESLKAQFSQTLLQSQLEIQEQTLRHISYELHDNLGQVASLIKINLNTLQFADINKATEKVESTKDLTRQLIADLKSLSVSLGSDHLSRTGLVKALEIEIERLNKTEQFVATFNNGTGEIDIPDDKAIILYRMVQEILNNSVKHSQAKHINLIIHNQENKFILAIKDDGIGFNIDEAGRNTSAGLKNLQNRAHLINATLNFYSSLGKGTEVIIELPANN